LATLVYSGPGVAVVAVGPYANGYEGNAASQLYLSTDMVRWTNVTPAASELPDSFGYHGWFDEASFLSPSTGWVISWNPDNLAGVIYRTTDGGRTWSAVAGGGHGDHGGDAFRLQLLTPSIAYGESVAATAPAMALTITTDAGKSWRTIYTGPSPQPPGATHFNGPFEMPMTFGDQDHGFATAGIPPAEPQIFGGDLFSTSDGGSTWSRESPPLPRTSLDCPALANPTSTTCLFGDPIFSGVNHGVLPTAVISAAHATVAFDVTSDGGRHWALTAQQAIQAVPGQGVASDSSNAFGYPLISMPTTSTWWLLGSSHVGLTTHVSTNGGATWKVETAPLPPLRGGSPTTINALDAQHALLTYDSYNSNGSTQWLLVTADGGANWSRIKLG
jgi:photosystem II stability/assembly factor-like uncharacterized protein